MVGFDVRNYAKELDKILKLQVCPSEFQDKVKEVVTDYWNFFCK